MRLYEPQIDLRKQRILDALGAFVRQRAGLEFGNYGDVKAYRAEQRSITRDRHVAEKLIGQVTWRGISADDLIAAARSAYSGRLSIEEQADGRVRVSYCTGQYLPTEYRRAVCVVLAAALWAYVRDKCMPAPLHQSDGRAVFPHIDGGKRTQSPGDWLRAYCRREFGAAIARRFFD